MLPMGWTNSVPIFHNDVTFILHPEIPHITIPYIDDVPVKGPTMCYPLPDGDFERIPENPGICHFIWEHFQNLNCIVQYMKYCGSTFSGFKSMLCAPEITVLGHRCIAEGCLPDTKHLKVIVKWGPCTDLSDVRSILGMIGVCRMFIKNFVHHAHHLIKLMHKDVPFEFSEEQVAVQEDLKQALLSSPALRPIDYTSGTPVILLVDTSYIAISYILAQCDPENPRSCYYVHFGSITLNKHKAHFSQPKLELYGLYRMLLNLKVHLIGICNLIIEVNASSIKGMLTHPDINPSASMNRWILAILTFHFELVHVPGAFHGPDGLLHQCPQPDDDPQEDDTSECKDWIDCMHNLMLVINPMTPALIFSPPSLIHISEAFITNDSQDTPTIDSDDNDNDNDVTPYSIIPQSEKAEKADTQVVKVRDWHTNFECPDDMTNAEYNTFVHYCGEFFHDGN